MPLDFDVETFLHNLKATKPPYECPVEHCGKVYKSFSGIQVHLDNYDHSVPTPASQSSKSARKKGRSRRGGQQERTPSPPPPEPVKMVREPKITYVDTTKMLEYDTEGCSLSFCINDCITIMSKSEYEALVPPAREPTPSPEPAHSVTATPSRHAPTSQPLRHVSVGGDERRTAARALPEASFTHIEDDYELADAPPLPNNYIRFIEKSAEELDEEIEYDMDEEDVAWLGITNEQRAQRGLTAVKEQHFEMLMDRLEKESFFQAQTTVGTSAAPVDEEALCAICADGECENSNVILFCDMCNLPVHQECYGVPYIPEGQWWCRRCLQSPSRAVDCVLCPNKGGAFKQTDDNRWAHVVCALWVPEVCFANTVFLEPIDSIDRIPPARWKLSCYICKQRNVGACIQCHKANCYTAFHVTCAQQAGMHMKIDAVRETSSTGTSFTVRKAAYCDIHTPADSDAKPQLDESSVDSARKAQAKAESRLKMRKARKILAERRSAMPVVSVPTIPPERVKHLASLIDYPRKNHFIQRLLAYWTLKRYSRNGVPLLRRLQVCARPTRRTLEPLGGTGTDGGAGAAEQREPAAADTAPSSKQKIKHSARAASAIEKKAGDVDGKLTDEKSELREQVRYWRRLRQDLEKVRLLCELVRKREKTKRELAKAMQRETQLRLAPLQYFLEGVVEQIAAKDIGGIFAEPVDTSEVTDYLSVISEPMDLSTISRKIEQHEYSSLQQLTADFDLMVDNCLTYNSPQTLFYKAGVRMRDAGGAILRRAVRDTQQIGFDGESGLLLTERPPPNEQHKSDEDVLEAVDQFLTGNARENMTDDEQIAALFQHLDTVTELKHGGSRVKWTKALRVEIAKLRRRKAMAVHAGTPGRKPGSHKSRRSESEMSALEAETTDGEDTEQCGDISEGARTASRESPAPAAALSPGHHRRRAATKVSSSAREEDAGSARGGAGAGKRTGRLARRGHAGRSGASESEPADPNVANDSASEAADAGAYSAPGSPAASARASAPTGVAGGAVVVCAAATSASATSSPASGVNRRTAVLFTKKAAGIRASPSPQKKDIRKRVRSASQLDAEADGSGAAQTASSSTSVRDDSGADRKEEVQNNSFTQYRQRTEVGAATDDDTASESADVPPPGIESGSDDSDLELGAGGSDLDDDDVITCSEIPLEPLDLVWAKCRGYPWYPALIINPKMPRTGYFHNGVPIPVPPEEVLALAQHHTTPCYLVLFFDAKRTWQWLPRGKLEPLGVDPSLDKAKLVESRKAADRKAVKTAYEKGILHQCRVTGKNAAAFCLEPATSATASD